MTTMEIPETIVIERDKVMKGQSYPVKTSDIVEALRDKTDKVSIRYKNANQTKDRWNTIIPSHHQWVVLIEHYGDTWPEEYTDFYMEVESIPSKNRKGTREVFKEKVLPFIAKWMAEQSATDIKRNSDRTLVVRYRRRADEEKGRIEIDEYPQIPNKWRRGRPDGKTLIEIEDVLIK